MKDKIIMFVIGALVGAILTGGGFLIFGQNKAGKMPDRGDMPNGQFQNSVDGSRPGKRDESDNQITQNNETVVNENTQTDENLVTE